MLTTRDVIHAFWVPRLGGKMDAVPVTATCCASRRVRPRTSRRLRRILRHRPRPPRVPGARARRRRLGAVPVAGWHVKALRLHRAFEAIWGTPKGWRGSLSTVNHSTLGIRPMVTAFAFFLIGGVLAMLIRAQLATSCPRSADSCWPSASGLFLIDVTLQFFHAPKSRRNPWGAGTLEWPMMLPSPSYNIASIPHVEDLEPVERRPALAVELARGEGYLGEPRNGWRETLAVETASGRIDHVVLLPGNSLLPVDTAAVTGVFFVAMLLKLYWITPLPLLALAVIGWRWAWCWGSGRTSERFRSEKAHRRRRTSRHRTRGMVGPCLPAGGRRDLLRIAAVRLCLSLDRRARLAAEADPGLLDRPCGGACGRGADRFRGAVGDTAREAKRRFGRSADDRRTGVSAAGIAGDDHPACTSADGTCL
ncbi:hypothetical protein [Sphingosinithalassobacter sp. CS137]|uniref:hypothetical protein n=1 Tax=Sphingosinithalassobacter sp. CS137 TaxID=2762748 RepID=UPI0021CF63FA|nr:hypothetical protein [Sphingosinithalassobacter sp. CS137]